LWSNNIIYILYHYENSYFFVHFLRFSRWLLRPYWMHVSEKIMQFWCSNFSQTDHFIQLHSCLVTQQRSSHSVQQSRSSYLSELPDFGLCTIYLKLFFLHVALCVFLWMICELVRTSLRRLLVTPDDPEFDNCGGAHIFMRYLIGVSFWETWMGVDGWTDEGVPTCHCIGLFNT